MTEQGRLDRRHGALAWMARNRIAANLLMLLFIAGGLLVAPRVQQEVFPEVTLDMVAVTVEYPGATPEEVESGVILAIEDEVRGLDGIKEVRSTAFEGRALVMAELLLGADEQKVRSDIESAVGRVTSFPADAERPIVSLATNRRHVVSLIVYGEASVATLREVAERIRQDLLATGDITLAEVTGLPPPEISIEISQETLRAYELTLLEVAQRVASASIDLPGGEIQSPQGDVLLRTRERREWGELFAQVPVVSGPGGQRVTVGELGDVIEGVRATDREAYYDGARAVKIDFFRVGRQTPTDVSEAVHRYADEVAGELPVGLQVAVWDDQSQIFQDRIDLLLRNAILGALLVIFILGLFLEPKVAFWVTLGIPISFLGAFLFMPSLDVSINMISLFAFILCLGIVVDDAIVVGEAIYRQRRDGKPPLRAAIAGAREVKGPVIFAVLTTIIAFLPMLFVPGVGGKFFRNIPLIVIPVLIISLVECFFILPAHLAHVEAGRPGGGGFLGRIRRLQARFSAWIERLVDRRYVPLVRRMARYRWVTLSAALAVLIAVGGYIAGGRIGFTFMPKVERDVLTAAVRMPVGTPLEQTREVIDHLIDTARGLDPDGALIRGVYADLGTQGQTAGSGPSPEAALSGGHLGEVAVALVPAGERDLSASELTRRWRQAVGEVPGAELLEFEYSIGAAGRPVAIELSHEDRETLDRAAEALAARVATYAGVQDVDDGLQRGKQQIDLHLRPEARALGVDETLLAREVRAAFYGAEVDRQQRGRDELRIYVRLPEDERRSMYTLERFRVQVPDGGEIPLEQAARLELGTAETAIERQNGRRLVTVTAEVDLRVTTGGEVTGHVVSSVLPELQSQFPGLTYSLGGEQQDTSDTLGSLRVGMTVALLAMYLLLAVSFRSYLQPIIVLAAIPFGVIGALGGHVLLGYELSLVSLLGMVALAGVVVNDSLVLVSAINDRRSARTRPLDAVVAGGARRFRPVVLTSLTTFFGLAPMIFETSVQARFLVPMAISLGFGVLFVTVIALILVPAGYMAIEDVKRGAHRRVDALRRRFTRQGEDSSATRARSSPASSSSSAHGPSSA